MDELSLKKKGDSPIGVLICTLAAHPVFRMRRFLSFSSWLRPLDSGIDAVSYPHVQFRAAQFKTRAKKCRRISFHPERSHKREWEQKRALRRAHAGSPFLVDARHNPQ